MLPTPAEAAEFLKTQPEPRGTDAVVAMAVKFWIRTSTALKLQTAAIMEGLL